MIVGRIGIILLIDSLFRFLIYVIGSGVFEDRVFWYLVDWRI